MSARRKVDAASAAPHYVPVPFRNVGCFGFRPSGLRGRRRVLVSHHPVRAAQEIRRRTTLP